FPLGRSGGPDVETLDVHVAKAQEFRKAAVFPRARALGTDVEDERSAWGSTNDLFLHALYFAGTDADKVCFSSNYTVDDVRAPTEDVQRGFDFNTEDETYWYLPVGALGDLDKVPAWPMPPGAVKLTAKLLEDKVTEQTKDVLVEGGGTVSMPVKYRKVKMGLCAPGAIPATANYLVVGGHHKKEPSDSYGNTLFLFALQ
ncbi:MAG TPA: hypothetical protein VGC41_11500, partial [Kofleriaceae bacterium]